MMLIQLRDYQFTIAPGSNKAMWNYINTGNWEKHSFDILDYFVPKNGIVLDLGAWSGVLSLYIAHKAKQVYALDPDPICFQELTTNITLNPHIVKKIKAYPFAISNKNDRVHLSARSSYGQSSSSILRRKRDKEVSKTIRTYSLPNFIKKENIKHIDFIKMDIEGAEFFVLPTLHNLLEQINYPTLYISFHYNFLNEMLYYKTVSSSFINKLLLKMEKIFRFSLHKMTIRKEISNLYGALKTYTYIYKTDGTAISFLDLEKQPELIKNTDLVFTNKKWTDI